MLGNRTISRARGAGSLLLALLCLCALPAAASAGCGGVEIAKPTKKVNPGGRPPLAIGDSVMLLALPDLAARGYSVNAHGCRGISEGLEILRKHHRRGSLPHLVVLALGADYGISERNLKVALNLMGPDRVLALVTPRELGGGTSSDADHVRVIAERYPDRTVLLDWVRYSKGHGNWFQPDGLHLTFAGAHAFAALLGQAIRFAKPPPPPDASGGLSRLPF